MPLFYGFQSDPLSGEFYAGECFLHQRIPINAEEEGVLRG